MLGSVEMLLERELAVRGHNDVLHLKAVSDMD
jgi:hypothetical protein